VFDFRSNTANDPVLAAIVGVTKRFVQNRTPTLSTKDSNGALNLNATACSPPHLSSNG
jgi:hypothetical protein